MTEPDMTRLSSPEPAMSNPGELRHTLTVEHVGALLSQAGVPRSRRQIIRYCQTGLLDAVKIPGPTGDQWYVAPVSLPKAIGDLKQWEAQRERQGMTQLDVSRPVQPTSGSDTLQKPHNLNPDTARHGVPEHAASQTDYGSKSRETGLDTARHDAPSLGQSDANVVLQPTVAVPGDAKSDRAAAGYLSQLEKRIEEKDDFIVLLKGQLSAKDDQISELSTRYRETHTLLGAMQRMIAPLLGQADPYQTVEQRPGARVDNSAPQGN